MDGFDKSILSRTGYFQNWTNNTRNCKLLKHTATCSFFSVEEYRDSSKDTWKEWYPMIVMVDRVSDPDNYSYISSWDYDQYYC